MYLQRLFVRLSPKEIDTLQALPFTESQQKVFDYIFANRHEMMPKVPAMAKQVGISPAHFRKVNSVVLQKCYQALAPEERIIQFLCAHTLHVNAMHEVKKLEKKYLKNGQTVALENLYRSIPRFFTSMDFSEYDEGFIQGVIEKYEQHYPQHVTQLLIMKMEFTFTKMNKTQAVVPKNEQERLAWVSYFKEQIVFFEKMHQQTIPTNEQYLSAWSLEYLKAEYFSKMEKNIPQAVQHYQTQLQIYEANSQKLAHSYKLNPSLRLVLLSFENSQFEEAFVVIRSLFEEFPQFLSKNLFWVDKLVQLGIILNQLDFTRAILEKYRPHDPANPGSFFQINDDVAIQLAIMDILEDKLDAAFTKIQDAKIGIQKTYFFPIDASLRLVENTYFYLIGETILADDMVTKNLKFYNYNKEKPNALFFKTFHRIIRHFIRNPFGNKTLPTDLETAYQDWQKGEHAFLGKLLEKIKDQKK